MSRSRRSLTRIDRARCRAEQREGERGARRSRGRTARAANTSGASTKRFLLHCAGRRDTKRARSTGLLFPNADERPDRGGAQSSGRTLVSRRPLRVGAALGADRVPVAGARRRADLVSARPLQLPPHGQDDAGARAARGLLSPDRSVPRRRAGAGRQPQQRRALSRQPALPGGAPVWALNAHLWIHLLLAPLAVYWLARSFDLEREAAWVAGFCYALSGFFLSQLNLYNLIAGTALAPAFAAACIPRFTGDGRRWARPRRALLLSLVALGGDPIVAALAVFLGFAACLILRRVERSRVAVLLSALGCGALVAAPQMVELWRVLDSSYRGGLGLESDVATGGELGSAQHRRALRSALLRPARSTLLGRDRVARDAPALLLPLSGRARDRAGARGGTAAPRRGRCGWWMVLTGGFVALGGWNPSCSCSTGCLSRPGCAIRSRPGSWSRSARRCSPGSASSAPSTVDRDDLSCSPSLAWARPSASPGGAHRLAATRDRDARRAHHADASRGGRHRAGPSLARALAFSLVLLALAALLVAMLAPNATRRGLPADRDACRGAARPAAPSPRHRRHRRRIASRRRRSRYIGQDERIAHGCSIAVGCDLGRPGSYPDYRMSWVQRRGWVELYPFAGAQHGLRYAYNVSPEGLDTVLVFAAQRAMREVSEGEALRLLAAAAVDVVLLDRPVDRGCERAGRAAGAAALDRRRVLRLRHPRQRSRGATGALGARRRHSSRAGRDDRSRLRSGAATPSCRAAAAGKTRASGGTAEIDSESWERLSVTTDSAGPGVLVLGRAWLPHYRAAVDGARSRRSRRTSASSRSSFRPVVTRWRSG